MELTPYLIQNLEKSPFNFVRQDSDLLLIDNPQDSSYITCKAGLSLPNVSSTFLPIDLSLMDLPTPQGVKVVNSKGIEILKPTGNCYFVITPRYNYVNKYLNNGLPTNLLSGNMIVDNGIPMTGKSYTVLNQNLAFYNNLVMGSSNSYIDSLNSNQLGMEMKFSQSTLSGFNLLLPRFFSGTFPQTLRFFNKSPTSIFNYQSYLSPVIPKSIKLNLQIKDINNLIYTVILTDNGLGKFIESDPYNAIKSSNILYESNNGKLYIDIVLNSAYTLDTQSLNTLQFEYNYDAGMLYNRSEIPFYVKNNTDNLLVVSSEDSYIDSPITKSIFCQPNQMIEFYPIISKNSSGTTNSFWSFSMV